MRQQSKACPDRELRKPGIFYGETVKNMIAVVNQTLRVLYVMVLDDVNATQLMKLKGGIGAGATSAKLSASAEWDQMKAISQRQTISVGAKSTFTINGDCAQIWVSDHPGFPATRMPYEGTRILKGEVKPILERKFQELGI